MRYVTAIFAALFCANLAFADASSHDAAARKVAKIMFAMDKPRLVQALSSGMVPGYSPEITLEVLESDDLAAIYVRNLTKVFSESELTALAEILDNNAYRVYTERLPTLAQSLFPEVIAYANRVLPELQRRAAERKKSSAVTGNKP